MNEKMTQRGLAYMLINLGQYLESEYGKSYRFAVQNWLEREYKLSTYSSDYDEYGNCKKWEHWAEENNICRICGSARDVCGGEEKHG